jgi:SagB-type dehydrogenase family enzyme
MTIFPPPYDSEADQSSERFHAQTSVVAMGEALPPVKEVSEKVRTMLPPLWTAHSPQIEDVIVARRSHRDFAPDKVLPLDVLARLLGLSCGIIADRPDLPGGYGRAIPSAGATYPIVPYVLGARVAGLASGSYRYDVTNPSLELQRAGDESRAFSHWALDQDWLAGAAAIIVMVGVPGRLKPRYASRGYRYMLFEAGHIAQNLCLLATAYGLAAQPGGGFVDTAVARLLGLSSEEVPLYFVAIGPRSGRDLPIGNAW